MLKEKEDFIRKIVILLDALVVTLAFWFSFLLRRGFRYFYKFDLFPEMKVIPQISSSPSDYIVVLFAGVVLWCAALYFNGMYKSMRTKAFSQLAWIIARSAFITAISSGTLVYILKFTFVSRSFLFVFILIAGAFLILEKFLLFNVARYLRKRGYNFRRILLVGRGVKLLEFMEKIRIHPEWGFKVVGIANEEDGPPTQSPGEINILGNIKELSRIIRRFCVDEVVFLIPAQRLNFIEEALHTCETVGVKATLALDFFDLKLAKARQTELDGMPFMSFETTRPREWEIFAKRAIDISISVAAIIILSPVMLAAALLVKMTSEGPVFFLQKRLGLNGRKFVLYKFRTMYKGSYRKQRELAKFNIMHGPVFKLERDPRITPVGKVLRKFSIDELPQLFNVFSGNMSLVGPRPAVTREVKSYELWQRRRLSMAPGITCLWQVNGRNKIIDFNEWMNLDLQYIDKWSLWLDLKVLLKTLPAVFSGRGAC